MNERSDPRPSSPDHWENYWGGAGAGNDPRDAAVTGAGRSEAFQTAWRSFFSQAPASGNSALRVIDLACGAGVVTEIAAAALPRDALAQTVFAGADYALSAVRQFPKRFDSKAGGAFGIVADAERLPFAASSFDIAVSQFGLEYAGLNAFDEAGRLVAPGGQIMCVAHYRNGAIEDECSENARITEEILKSGVFDKMRVLFTDIANTDAVGQVRKTLRQLSAVAEASPPSAGLALLGRLGTDLTRLLERRAAFEPREILTWLETNKAETSMYRDRMRAMIGAALDVAQVRDIMQSWSAAGLETDEPEPMSVDPKTPPSAWRLCARRPEA